MVENPTDQGARLLSDAQSRHSLDVGTLFSALHEITDDPPDEGSAEILARALGCLQAAALLHLVHETRRALHQFIDSGVDMVEIRIRKFPAESRAGTERETVTIEAVRGTAEYRNAAVVRLAVIFQALLWAIEVPPDDLRSIVY